MSKLRVLVVDDEALARKYLRRLLAAHPDCEIVAECGDGHSAVEQIRTQSPDVVFLDVQMPELTGVEVVRRVGPDRMPIVVFITAYDRYAVEAFDVHALDYLVKPFDAERFARTMDRVRAKMDTRQREDLNRRLVDLLENFVDEGEAGRTKAASTESAGHVGKPDYLARIPVKVGDRVTVLRVQDIDWLEAADYCVNLHSGGRAYTLRDSLQALEAQLDPAHFFRIHRGAIVNLECVRELRTLPGGDFNVLLHSGASLRLSRRRKADLEKLLGRSF